MWLIKIKLKHDCTIGNRMPKFNLMTHITYLGSYTERGIKYSIGMHRLIGDDKDVKNFFEDFKKDKNVKNAKLNKNIMIVIERSTFLPIGKFENKLFFQKPVFVDSKGYEYWEFFSFDKKNISTFIKNIRPLCNSLEIKKLINTNLDDFYFPHAIPNLTNKQKRAIELAMEHGYYSIPRKITIRKLAQIMKISKSTYQDLLRRAENKLVPDLINMHLVE